MIFTDYILFYIVQSYFNINKDCRRHFISIIDFSDKNISNSMQTYYRKEFVLPQTCTSLSHLLNQALCLTHNRNILSFNYIWWSILPLKKSRDNFNYNSTFHVAFITNVHYFTSNYFYQNCIHGRWWKLIYSYTLCALRTFEIIWLQKYSFKNYY